MSNEEMICETVLYNMQDAKNVSCFHFYSRLYCRKLVFIY